MYLQKYNLNLQFQLSVRRTIETAIKKGNKQIKSTKIILEQVDAKSLIFICNDGNHALHPQNMFAIICKLMEDNFSDSEIDGIVYFTVNSASIHQEENREYIYWMPVYKVNNSSLGAFVNRLGKQWWDFYKKKINEELLSTPHLTGVEALNKIRGLRKYTNTKEK